jgi:hypothetical protein
MDVSQSIWQTRPILDCQPCGSVRANQSVISVNDIACIQKGEYQFCHSNDKERTRSDMRIVDLTTELGSLLSEGMVVPVVGAGVSMATSGTPGWKALLDSGLAYLIGRGLLAPTAEAQIKKELKANQLTSAAVIIQKEMGGPGGGEYAAWLRDEFDDQDWKVSNSQLITEILDLPCPLIATTNYDYLLERFDANLRRTTVQTQPASMITALRRGGIFHLHGVYTEPLSVILSENDYSAVLHNEAYRSIIEALWTTKSLLFIGCSFDGVTDPDFRKLFKWAASTFGPASHRHYMLVLDEMASVENSRQFLLGDLRLQLVPFGERHQDLARFVIDINPSRPKARLRRATRANELLASPDAIDLESYLNAVGSWISPDKIQEFEAQARIAFNQRCEQVERNRATLSLIKVIFDSIPEKKEIVLLNDRWQSVSIYSDNTQQICSAALSAILTIPPVFLHELARIETVNIPASVVQGMSQSHMRSLEALLTSSDRENSMRGDDYGFELIGRILRTYDVILGLDCDSVFPPPLQSRRVDLRGTFIAVGSSSGVTIIDTTSFLSVSYLGTSSRVRELVEIQYKGSEALLILMSDRLLIWDPRRAGPPLLDVTIPADGSATKIVLDPNADPGEFRIKVSSFKILNFSDLRHVSSVELTAAVDSFASVDNVLYASINSGGVYQLSSDASMSIVLTRDQLIGQIVKLRRHVPIIAKWHEARITAEIRLWLQHAFLKQGRINGQEVLMVCLRFDIAPDGNTAVFFGERMRVSLDLGFLRAGP